MELVKYTLCDIELMMVDIEGTLYCSTPQLEMLFGADRSNLTKLVKKHPEEFSQKTAKEFLTGSNVPRKEVLKGLGLSRLRKDTRLWSEDDIIGFTWLVRSDIARKCRAEFKHILKQHAKRDYVPRDQFEVLMRQHNEVMTQLPALQEAVNELMEDKRKLASHAGAALRLVRRERG